MKSEIYLCNCSGEGISVQKFDENEIDISLWCRGTRPRMSLKDRIRYIWQIISKGYAWADEIIITNETAKQLGEYLINVSKEYKPSIARKSDVVNMNDDLVDSTKMIFYSSCVACGALNTSDNSMCNRCGEASNG